MKLPLMVLVLSGVGVAGAGTVVESEGLPPVRFADTEAVTNVACASWVRNLRHFEIRLELTATSSNCVTVAFGRDTDQDGVLSRSEAAFEVGWDCGHWLARGGFASAGTADGTAGFVWPAVTDAARKQLRWRQKVLGRRNAGVQVTENGQTVTGDESMIGAGWCYDPAWNLARICVRGVDAAAERVRVTTETVGLGIFVR